MEKIEVEELLKEYSDYSVVIADYCCYDEFINHRTEDFVSCLNYYSNINEFAKSINEYFREYYFVDYTTIEEDEFNSYFIDCKLAEKELIFFVEDK